MTALIVALGLTFFPGQPHWYELDTSGVEWTVSHFTIEDIDWSKTDTESDLKLTPDDLDFLKSITSSLT